MAIFLVAKNYGENILRVCSYLKEPTALPEGPQTEFLSIKKFLFLNLNVKLLNRRLITIFHLGSKNIVE